MKTISSWKKELIAGGGRIVYSTDIRLGKHSVYDTEIDRNGEREREIETGISVCTIQYHIKRQYLI